MKKRDIWFIVVGMLLFFIAGRILISNTVSKSDELEKAIAAQVKAAGSLREDIARASVLFLAEREEQTGVEPEAESPKEESAEAKPEGEAAIVPDETKLDVSAKDTTKESEKTPAGIIKTDMAKGITAKRISSTEISVFWNGVEDDSSAECEQYVVMRKGMSASIASDLWEEVGAVRAGQALQESTVSGTYAEYKYSFTDVLPSSAPVQYAYRIDGKAADGTLYAGIGEGTVVASNILICIDPGHYKGAATSSGENMYGFEEGIFTLRVGLALREELAKHGINSYLTRETDSITIDGYTNEALDKRKIVLRGTYAKGSNLFISIHTNANSDNANGCDTWQQPLELNKTLLFLNQTASGREQVIWIANEIGAAVTATSYRLGLSVTDQFERVAMGSLLEWTGAYNESINAKGTVCYRLGDNGDYYGVLRGAASVGVPGMIIEHGFHTIEELRKQAMTENLAGDWARADADGIVKGLGFQ